MTRQMQAGFLVSSAFYIERRKKEAPAGSITAQQVAGMAFLFPGNDATSETGFIWSHHVIRFRLIHCHCLRPICLPHWPN